MATVPPVAVSTPPDCSWDSARLYLWEAVTTADSTGDPVEIPGLADRTVQVVGTFGGGTVKIQGSLDGTNYADLADLSGTAIGLTAAGIAVIQAIVRYIRPVITGSTGADVDVYLLARKP